MSQRNRSAKEETFKLEHGITVSADWRRRNPARVTAYGLQQKLRRKADPVVRERYNATARRSRLTLKLEALIAYGEDGAVRCVCCGELNVAFLTLDHVNNDGAAHKRTLGHLKTNGSPFYQRLKTLGWPTDPPIQVMCFNCNCGKRINGGVCPHKEGL